MLRFVCSKCNREEPSSTSPLCCGQPMVRRPNALGVTVKEQIDNGWMSRRVEPIADITRINNDRNKSVTIK